MNILYITARDYMGQQFNGYLLKQELEKRGHTVNMYVDESRIKDNHIHQVNDSQNGNRQGKWHKRFVNFMNDRAIQLEENLSLYSLLPIASWELYTKSWFREADIIHLQVPHAKSFFSLFQLPVMGRQKKVIWTMHDPWMTTGHCVYPQSCMRWLTGCGSCPDLKAPLKIQRDTTALMWKLKYWILKHTAITLTVASKWMADQVASSPILSGKPCHLIPFGVDFNIFKPYDREDVRASFGIPQKAKVIAFRSQPFPNSLKGTEYIESALNRLRSTELVYLITFDTKGGLQKLRDRYNIIELGWVTDQIQIARTLSAADIFLMPSIAEAFGLMAIESMACGTPVVVFDNTSLPEVVHAPEGGIAVPYKNDQELAKAIQDLFENAEWRLSIAEAGKRIVKDNYTIDHYVDGHLNLYHSLMAEKTK